MYKVLFFGTSEFAVPSLTALAGDGRFYIMSIVTKPDSPVGRHAVLTPPPIKLAAAHLGLKSIKQPEKIKDEDFMGWIRTVGPDCDAFVVVSYGKILPQWLLDLPKHGVVNVHGSLLPRWRGASPIQAAIAAGDAMSGVSIMSLDALMDHGPVITEAEEPIRDTDTGGALHDRLAARGGDILPDTLARYLTGELKALDQDHAKATMCKILTREDGKLDWSKDAIEIERLVRAYQPWPGTWTEHKGKRLKISAARVGGKTDHAPGMRFMHEGLPCIACGNGTSLCLLELQPEGKPVMSADVFLRGNDWT